MSRPEAYPAPYVAGRPIATARLRTEPADFEVHEQLPITPSGDGEHLWLQACKSGVNTAWLADTLARHYGVPARDVGYAGRKDRHARTVQWFSVRLPGRTPAAEPPELEDVQWLQTSRHRRKLATGALTGNRFRLVLRELQDPDDLLASRLRRIAAEGVPNWFGPQRFGRGGANLELAWRWLVEGHRPRSRNARSIALSAARAWGFNRVLAARVRAGNWQHLLEGERAMLAGSHSHFAVTTPDDPELQRRLESFDIHPGGPLPGRGASVCSGASAALETAELEALAPLVAGLAAAGADAARRALRVVPANFAWQRQADRLTLEFALPAGSFATAVLRECVTYDDATDAEACTWS